jgi:DNA polymerase-3 subunit delta
MAKAASGKSTSAKSSVISALEYLADPKKYPVTGVCAVSGDEAFLKSEVLVTIRRTMLAGEDAEFSLTTLAGRDATLRDVADALSTVSLFGDGRRLVIVEEADSFVTEYRAELEDFVTKLCDVKRSASAAAVLVLDVKTWQSNTRLAKIVAANGLTIQCTAPKERELKTWLTKRAKSEHQVRLDSAAADALFELVPPEIGIVVQELSKLALLAGESRVIDAKLVQENVGGWRARATWDMIDAAADGNAASALRQLDRLIASGEKPHALFPQMASSLRRFATAVELIDAADADRRRVLPRDALARSGVLPFKLRDAERQLRQIGRERARQILSWLLAVDLAIKGHNSADDRARIELERLIVRLGKTPGRVPA